MHMKNVTKPSEPSPRRRIKGPRLSLAVQRAIRATDAPSRIQIQQFARAALERDAEITLRIVNTAEGCQLNHEFRHKDYPTNILSFVYETDPIILGDLVLCAPVITAEALAQGKTSLAHYAHLIVHGVLHLQGYDHESDTEAARMEAQEIKIVTKLGFANPYLETELLNHA